MILVIASKNDLVTHTANKHRMKKIKMKYNSIAIRRYDSSIFKNKYKICKFKSRATKKKRFREDNSQHPAIKEYSARTNM